MSARLPLPVTRAFGKAIGSLAGLLFPFRRRVGLINLRLCFPDWTENERRRLLFKHYQSMGMGIFEMAAAWYKPDLPIRQIADVKGLEHLEAVQASGRGAILLTAHFTTLEMTGRALLVHRPFSCLYRKPNQPYIARVMTECRTRLMRRVIHFDKMPELVRALRDGEFVWYAPDQGKRMKYSEILPFFGVPAITNTATGRIAKMGKAAILPFFGYRDAHGRYQIEILPELTDIPSDNPDADAIAINHLIENFIRRAPEQYFWLHRRFKARGKPYPDPYAR
jgi:KDO2-lipid IV(A) lauroyltransferase